MCYVLRYILQNTHISIFHKATLYTYVSHIRRELPIVSLQAHFNYANCFRVRNYVYLYGEDILSTKLKDFLTLDRLKVTREKYRWCCMLSFNFHVFDTWHMSIVWHIHLTYNKRHFVIKYFFYIFLCVGILRNYSSIRY